MPIVKNVLVRLKADGAARAKADMDALAVRARELAAMDPTIRMSVEDRNAVARLAALRFELRALKLAGDKVGLERVAGEARLLGANLESPRAKVRALGLEMEALQAAAADAAGPNGLGKFLSGIPGAGGPVTGGLIAGGVLTALTTGLAGLIPMLVAAGMGIVSFGALAYPTFSKVKTAVTSLAADTQAYQNATTKAAKSSALHKIQDDWKALDPAQRQAVKGVQALGAEFTRMATQMEPVVMRVLNEGLKIAAKLLPDLLPFAKAAGGAIVDLLRGFDRFASSPGFKAFLANMAALSGPAIETIVTGLAQITIALGKFIVSLENPDMLRAAKYLFEGIAAAITGLAWLITGTTVQITALMHGTAVAFDHTRHAIADFAHNVAAHFDEARHDIARWAHDAAARFAEVRHAIARWLDDIRHGFAVFAEAQTKFGAFEHDIAWGWDRIRHVTAIAWDGIRHMTAGALDFLRHQAAAAFDAIRHTIATWADHVFTLIGHVVTWFSQLPGRIIRVLASLPGMLFHSGQNAVSGFIHGLLSMMGALASAAGSLVSKVARFFGLSPALEGPLAGSGSMFIRGQHLTRDLAAGMASGTGYVGAASGLMARAAIPGGAMAGGGGGGVLRLEVVGHGGGMLDQLFISWLRNYVRVAGGGGPQSVQRALGVVWR